MNYVRFICFVSLFVIVNHFSVTNDKSACLDFNVVYKPSTISYRYESTKFSLNVESPTILQNITYNGDVNQLSLTISSYNVYSGKNCEPIDRDFDLVSDNIASLLKNIKYIRKITKQAFFSMFQGNPVKLYPLFCCVITTLIKLFGGGSVRCSNYRIIDTPRRVFIKKRRSRSRNLRLFSLFTLLIIVIIRTNDTTNLSTESLQSDFGTSEVFNNISSIYMASKGKPLRMNLYLVLILSGDVETNPGPPIKRTCNNTTCFRTIAKTHRFVACTDCEHNFHIKCAGVTPKAYNKMKAEKSITFICQPCISNTLPFPDVDLTFDDDFILPENIQRFDLFKNSSLNIAHLNVNGLRSKLDFVKILLNQEKFDVFCVNETKIDSTVSDSDISIPGYISYRQDRTLHGGGSIIYCSKNLQTKKNNRLSSKKFESVWVEVRFKKTKPIYVCSLYRPPSTKAMEHTESYTQYISTCFDNLQKNSEVFILGDWNVDVSRKSNLSSLITEMCRSRVLTQHVSSPTRITEHSSTMIDLVLSNSKNAKDCQVIDLGISDHSLVFIRRERAKVDRSSRKVRVRSLKNFNDQAFLEDLGDLDWSTLINSKTIDEAVEIFNSNVLGVLNRHAPFIERRISNSSPPWVDEVLLNAIQERDYLKKIASRTEINSLEWQSYKRKRNSVVELKNRLKKEYYQKILKDNKSESRKLWKTLKTLVPDGKKSNMTPHSLSLDDNEISDKKEMAAVFNKFFATVGSKLGETFNFSDTLHICPPVNKNHFSFSHVKLSTVQKIISNLDNNKATGLDGINVHALKSGSPILSYYLTHLFNLSLTTGTVPKSWKKKRVTPVFKKGDADDVNNYRPISILPVTMKIFEKVVHSQVSIFLDSSNILSDSQSGFRSSRSTDTAVVCVSDFILEELGKKRYVGAVLVDLKKAFDTVDHKILLKKLFCYGLRDTSFSWFESYLSDRVQCTILEDISSSFLKESPYGVPQGSVLGPLLFLIYINDIGLSIRPTTFHHLYADDTIIIVSSDRPVNLRKDLEDQLSELGHWFHHNKLTVNTEKTEVIFFGRKQKVEECKELAPIKFQGDTLDCKNCVKYLGVVFDEGMSWDTHAKAVRKKAYFKLSKIKKVAPFLTKDTKKLLVNALVMPHLTYCCNSWSSMSKSNLKQFDSMVKSIAKVSPINKTFEKIVNYNKAIMVFKGVHEIAPTYLSRRVNLVNQRHIRNTRFRAQNNLIVPNGKNTFAQRTFLNTATTNWNNLPIEIKMKNSFLQFKSSIKLHFFS